MGLRTRVNRMERAARAGRSRSDARHRFLMSELAADMLEIEPGLALVDPEDTDPETYRRVRATLAWAGRDYRSAEELEAGLPRPPGPRLTGDMEKNLRAHADWHRRVMVPAIEVEIERQRSAVEQARARIGGGRHGADRAGHEA